jgi:hypothetical protein
MTAGGAGALKPALLGAVTLAFGVAPFVTPPFTGFDPAQFPVAIDRPAIQPAGYAFSIWSVIYLWLFAHALFGLLKRRADPAWDRVRWPLIASLAIGTVWLAIAGLSPVWATLTIWAMAATALAAFLRADSGTDRWLLSAPLAIYAGWLSAAAAVSTGVLVAGYGLLPNDLAAVAMIALVLMLAVSTQRRQPAMPVYGLTVIWALAGVMVANGTGLALVTAVAAATAAALAALLWQQRRRA